VLGFFKIKRNVDGGLAALLPMRIANLVHEEAIDAGAKKCAQLAFCGVEGGEKVFLQQAGEKVLGKILGILALHVPAQAHILIYRTPVRAGDGIHGAASFRGIAALRGRHHGVAGQGKCVALWIGRQGNSF
jgi:hypothetical protein